MQSLEILIMRKCIELFAICNSYRHIYSFLKLKIK